tara:strand:- start:3815 stop:4561 length:747 start_codon:yes stop_codon:yes gene_type:complete
MPMVCKTYYSAKEWPLWTKIYVATDDQRVVDACEERGIPAIMTRDDHTDCLDRANEAVEQIEASGEIADRYIVIQGDEPLFNPDTLNVDFSPEVVNFYTQVQDKDEIGDVNAVKVVVSRRQKALYFSRHTVPYSDKATRRSDEPLRVYKQIGVYSFSSRMLRQYCNLSPSYLENLEGIGLLRFLENDIDINMRYTKYDSVSVDTEEDRQRILDILNNQEKNNKKNTGRGRLVEMAKSVQAAKENEPWD